MTRQDEALEWLREVVPKYCLDSRPCGLSVYTAEPYLLPQMECHVDLPPQEGRVLEATDEWILLRTLGQWYFVCARDLVDRVPVVGSTVRITPYARRDFDGKRLDAGNYTEAARLVRSVGHWRAVVPIKTETLRSARLITSIEHIECLRAPDRIRRLSHVLIDAGAPLHPLSVVDATRGLDRSTARPSITSRVQTQKADGWLRIECAAGLDEYRPYLLGVDGDLRRTEGPVAADVLTSLIVEWVDDGQWRIAKVEAIPGLGAN